MTPVLAPLHGNPGAVAFIISISLSHNDFLRSPFPWPSFYPFDLQCLWQDAMRELRGFRVQGAGFRGQGSGTAFTVIPAKAGIHVTRPNLDPRLRGDDGSGDDGSEVVAEP